MKRVLFDYNGEYTIEQRKQMTAEALRVMRKDEKLSQKEVAAYLKIPATTYNTYESGRTEPPIEILVRLSHLYQIPIDFIVQCGKSALNSGEDFNKQWETYKDDWEQIAKQFDDAGKEPSSMAEFIAAINRLADAMTAYCQTEAAQKAINKPVQQD